jgi:hypothetical protein
MGLKKSFWGVAIAFALAVTASLVWAADISNLSGQSCGDLSGTWHFVNNQTGGAPAGVLTANWSSGDSCVVTASAVNANTQHFYCSASGTLLSAYTTLRGKLVLSDFSCEQKPPPCDPKKDPTCK